MARSSTDFHHRQKSFRIKADDDKFLSRFVTKESSNCNSSFTVYYGVVPSSVPFTWESRPGTPKHAFSDNYYSNIPPLTPPPSYYNNVLNLSNSSSKICRSRSKMFFGNLLRRMNPSKKNRQLSVFEAAVPPSHSRSYSCSFSSSSSSSFSDHPMSSTPRRRRRFSSWGSSFDNKVWSNWRMNGEDINGETPPPVKGGYNYSSVKKALLSIVGRGSA